MILAENSKIMAEVKQNHRRTLYYRYIRFCWSTSALEYFKRSSRGAVLDLTLILVFYDQLVRNHVTDVRVDTLLFFELKLFELLVIFF